jgi:HSP20 family protein
LFSGFERDGSSTCRVDILEQDDAYIVTADLPGWLNEDVNITFEDGVLTIAGTREDNNETAESGFHLRERRTGSFSRRFRLPAIVDETKVDAVLEDGVLSVTVNKREEVQPRRIEIRAN